MRLSPFQALLGVFAMNAVAYAIWLPRIPDIKAALGLDVWTLSIALLGGPVGAIVGLTAAARITRRLGLRRACMVASFATPLALILPAMAGSALVLTTALFVVGLAHALTEVAINSMANAVQKSGGRRIMSRCHGVWSFGAMAGGLIGGALSQAEVSVLHGQVISGPLAALAMFAFAWALPKGQARADTGGGAGFVMPSAALVVLCVVPIGALMIEGAMLDWSVLFMRDVIGTNALWAAVVLSVFNLAMGFGRLTGDWSTDAWGVSRMMAVSGLSLGVGVLAFAFAPGYWAAFLAAIFAGYGASNIYPLALSLAPDVPGKSAEHNVAAIVVIAMTGMLMGPPLIGFVGSIFGLWAGFAVLSPFGIMPAIMVWLGIIGNREAQQNS